MNTSDPAVSEGPAAGIRANRVPAIDVARGLAIVLMVLYHTCWDLTFFNLVRFDLLGSGFWLSLRTGILSMFLGLVGVALVLATRRGILWSAVLRRLAVIGGCAVVVTVASWQTMPDSFIFFGVLHHIVVASALGLACVRLPLWALLAGSLACLGAPYGFADPLFDQDWLRWIGLMTHPPQTNDYVPVLPWFGVVLAGIALGRGVVAWEGAAFWRWRPGAGPGRLLAWAGRRSLILYMAHQPVLLGALYLVATLSMPGGVSGGRIGPIVPEGRGVPEKAEAFLGSCQVSCEKSGGTLTRCAGYCRCVVVDLNGRGLWPAFRANSLDDAAKDRVVDVIRACAARQ